MSKLAPRHGTSAPDLGAVGAGASGAEQAPMRYQAAAIATQEARAAGAALVKDYGLAHDQSPIHVVQVERLGDGSMNFHASGPDGAKIGWLSFQPHGNCGYVDHLNVAEDFRRQGIATALYREAQRWCLENGVLWLEGQLENEDGIPLRIRESLPGAETTLWVNLRALYRAMDELGLESEDVDYIVGESEDDEAPERPPHVDDEWAELCEYPKELMTLLAQMGVNEAECFLLAATRLRARPEIGTAQFGAWFKGSEVVKDGKPLVVYHGTDKVFWSFDQTKTADSAFWFTSNLKGLEEGTVGAAGKGIVMPCYLACRKLAGWDEYERLTFDQLLAEGYDGVRLDDDFIVFDPTRIKSAEHNDGAFDPENPDIRS